MEQFIEVYYALNMIPCVIPVFEPFTNSKNHWSQNSNSICKPLHRSIKDTGQERFDSLQIHPITKRKKPPYSCTHRVLENYVSCAYDFALKISDCPWHSEMVQFGTWNSRWHWVESLVVWLPASGIFSQFNGVGRLRFSHNLSIERRYLISSSKSFPKSFCKETILFQTGIQILNFVHTSKCNTKE